MRAAAVISSSLLLVLLLATDARDQTAALPPSKWDDHLIELDRQALDAAYQHHVELLFSTWMKDYAQPNEPQRLRKGARNAREAYIRAMTVREQTEQARKR